MADFEQVAKRDPARLDHGSMYGLQDLKIAALYDGSVYC